MNSIQEKLTFGKHTGKSLEEIVKEDPAYMVWMHQNFKVDNKEVKKWIKEQAYAYAYGINLLLDSTKSKLTHGKHSGKTVEQLMKEEPSYLEWLLKNPTSFVFTDELRKELKKHFKATK